MSDEVIDQPTEEVEVEDYQVQDADEAQPEELAEDQAEPDVPDDDEEVEYEGNKYKVPKELKDALLRQADYTRKTQEVAESRRVFEQEREEFQQRIQLERQHIQDFSQLHAIDAQIERFNQIDWQALIDSDPVEAMKLDRQFRTLSDARQSIAQRIQEVEQHQAFQRQRDYATAMEKGREVLQREIPNWSQDKAKELREFATSVLKVAPQKLDNILDPEFVVGLHYAQIGYQTLKQAASKPKPQAEVKPVQKVSSKRDSTTVNPDKLSADDWVKWREKQLRSRK